MSTTGPGTLSALSVTGQAVNLGTNEITQTVSGGTYTLSAGGSGTGVRAFRSLTGSPHRAGAPKPKR